MLRQIKKACQRRVSPCYLIYHENSNILDLSENMTPEALKTFDGNHIKISVERKDMDFLEAKEMAKSKAKEFAPDPMLLSWYNGKNGDYYPKLDCGFQDKPVWVIFAESRGADLAININNGEYIFLFLSLL